MGFLRNIQEYLLAAELKKVLARSARDKKFISYEKSRNIGILYKVGEEKDQIEFSGFVSRLQNEKKEIKALGIIKYRDIPHYCYPKLSYDYVTRRNINWMRKPTGEKVSDFILKEFDILINFDTTNDIALNYIAGLSHARCKVGLFHENNQAIYDLMINTDINCHFNELAEHYLTYLAMFSQES
jgi:hypothetical protein